MKTVGVVGNAEKTWRRSFLASTGLEIRGEVSLMFARIGVAGGAIKAKPDRHKEHPMAVEPIRDKGQTLSYPSGKVLGIVDTRAQFDEVVAALKKAGFDRITALHGEDGVQLLERVNTFFFMQFEERVLERHIQELKEGHFIIAVETPSSRADEAANVAAEHGARRLVHFGPLAVTWLK